MTPEQELNNALNKLASQADKFDADRTVYKCDWCHQDLPNAPTWWTDKGKIYCDSTCFDMSKRHKHLDDKQTSVINPTKPTLKG